MKRGLTLGKYAPLHKGHQLVIETALAEMDEVLVIIYNAPDTTNVPLDVRADWIRKIYPQVKVIEAWDGPTIVGNAPEIKRMHEDYVINKLKIKGITHFYSSEFYGEHMSRALNAFNRLIDPERKIVQISGTKIRTNPTAFREFMHSLVFEDWLRYENLLGNESQFTP
jgi:cytidyltransferase-like protein